jgi:hypothetical protein
VWFLSCNRPIVDPHSNILLCTLHPQDKSENASGLRRALATPSAAPIQEPKKSEIAPLLKDLIAQYSATGLPPAYIPKGEDE